MTAGVADRLWSVEDVAEKVEAGCRAGETWAVQEGIRMKTYNGSCHCGDLRFQVEAEIDHVRVCDCSICRKRGALLFRVPPERFRLVTPIESATLYTFHTHTARDYFCPRCGILPFRRPRTDPGVWSVNVRCLDGVNLDVIPIKRVFGSQLP